MYDVITFGSAVRDAFFYSKRFKITKDDNFITGRSICFNLGSKIEVDDVVFDAGGGAVNNSISFSKLGLRAACVAKIGNDVAGAEILKRLKAEKVDSKYCLKDKKLNTAYSVIISTKGGGRSILVYRGASKHVPPTQISWSKLKCKWFYMSSLTGNFELMKKIYDYAGRNNIKIAFNPGSKELKNAKKLKPYLAKTDILFLNQEESSILTKVPYNSPKKIINALNGMVSGISVMTQGEKGVMVSAGNKTYSAGILRGKVEERTGAGDAFGSGFTAGIMQGKSVEYSIQLGTANSTYVIKKVGATMGLLEKKNIKNIPKVKVKVQNK
jgi:sugar/nucleoside kinase (ribokinase family)